MAEEKGKIPFDAFLPFLTEAQIETKLRDIAFQMGAGSKRRKIANGWMVQCPGHPDRTPSLSIRRIPGTTQISFRCFAGCEIQDLAKYIPEKYRNEDPGKSQELPEDPEILRQLAREQEYARNPFVDLSGGPALPRTLPFRLISHDTLDQNYANLDRLFWMGELCGPPTGIWLYESPEEPGLYLFAVARYETPSGKDYRPWSKIPTNPIGGFAWENRFPEPFLPLWNVQELIARIPKMEIPKLILCEGELSAEAAGILFPEIPCSCWAMGSSSLQNTDFAFLQRFPGLRIAIWPDPDVAGHRCRERLGKLLDSLGIPWLEPDFGDLFGIHEDAAKTLQFLAETSVPLKRPKMPGMDPAITGIAQEKCRAIRSARTPPIPSGDFLGM